MCSFLVATLVLLQMPLQARETLSEVKISVRANNQSLKKTLREIERQSGMMFVYLNNQVDDNRKVSLEIQNGVLKDVLDSLFSGTDIVYKQLDRQILLKRVNTRQHSFLEDEDDPHRFSESPTISVTGKVKDKDSQLLPGVNVIEKGTTNGTTTDANGFYALGLADENSILVFSFIGYATQEVLVGKQTQIDITMLPDVMALQEVVVVGYGTQERVNVTGAVASVKGEEIVKRPVTNAATMLQGRMAGVQIIQNSGEPGNEGASIRIRGVGSFSGSASDPLVLIDGVPGSLANLNPNNIETVSVLKDAASASIYGARASNGVVLVTTKSGKEGKVTLEYTGNFAIHRPTKLFDLITNSAEYMELYNEARINSGLNAQYTNEMIETYRNATDRKLYPNTDWLDIMFSPAPTQMHNLGFSGGNNGTTFDLSLGYVNQEGVMKGFDFQRYNMRLNLSSKINDNVKFGGNIALRYGNKTAPRQGAQDTFLATMSQAPTYGPKLADGSGFYTNKAYSFEYNNKNPVAIVENGVNRNTEDYVLQTQGWIDVKVTKWLSWFTKGALNLDFVNWNEFMPVVQLYDFRTNQPFGNLDVGGFGLRVQDERNVYKNLFSYLNFEHTFGDRHELNAKIGYNAEDNVWRWHYGARRDYPNQTLRELIAGGQAVQEANGTQEEWALMSFFGRVGYNFADRYLFEANVRYDGSSRLSPDQRWQAFPSFSAGWRISEEQFLKNAGLTWLGQLKMRASYGKLGNQSSLGLYPYQPLLEFRDPYSFDNNVLTTGVGQRAMNNPNLIWETTTGVDVGLDASLFEKLDLTFDWYRKTTTDALRQSQLTALPGLSPPFINNGTMQNTGVELGIQFTNRVYSGYFTDLNYNFGFNFDHFRNELTEFGAREIDGNNYSIREEGHEWNSFYMLESIGIFQSENEIAASPKQYNDNTQPGDLKFKDQDGDNDVDNDDRIHIDGRYPSFNYALNLSATWKGFDLSGLFQGVEGVKYYVRDWGTVPFIQGSPPTTSWRDRYTDANPSTTVPRIYFGNNAPERITRHSSWYLQDASYLRLKNITFGYTLPRTLTERIRVSQLRVYFSGDNLITFTQYPGLDPERGNSGSFVNYPQNKIYSFGVNVKF